MKISYNWLKEYVDTDLSPEKMGEILTDTGLEVEGIEKVEAVKGGLQGVVVGEVLTCEQHPDADRLKVTTVNLGSEVAQIVCGAPNVAAGQKVIVATVGTTLYPSPEEAFKIKKSKIRGVESDGMLCAEDELGLGKSHDGILVLDENTPVGMSAATYFELEDDFDIEIGLTPNRADAMGHIGVARDLVAYLNVHEQKNLQLKWPILKDIVVGQKKLDVSIDVENDKLCPKYAGITLTNVKVKPSPAWLQKKLRAVGLSPINNVVDITNYVMRELGTPLHAFDCSQLGGKIVVKEGLKNQKMTTLDGVERTLQGGELMITNGTDLLCIAGVFGGETSGVSESTTEVFLESAYFDAVSVRQTAKQFGLNTDASFRFERGVDPGLTEYALLRAAQLIMEIAGAEAGMEMKVVGSGIATSQEVSFSYSRCNKVIGTEIDKITVDAILKALDIEIINEKDGVATLKVPAYRVDVLREADVIEEVLRIYGFNRVPLPEKLNSSISKYTKPDVEKIQKLVSEFLVGKGCVETLNNSLTSSKYVDQLGNEVLKADHNVKMLNPLSQELDVMRQSLLFNALEVVTHNQNRQHPDLQFFEFGKTYKKFESGYDENKRLMIALSGRKFPENWNDSNDKQSYYSMKGMVASLFQRMGLWDKVKESPLKKSLLHDGVKLSVLKEQVGEMGWINKETKKYFGIKQDVFIADLDWDALMRAIRIVKIKFQELPKTFEVRRDFSLLLNSEVQFSEIVELAKASDRKILKDIGLFDVYEGDKLPEGKKSYAVSFKFQDDEKTLQDKQIDAVMEKIRAQLEQKLGAELR